MPGPGSLKLIQLGLSRTCTCKYRPTCNTHRPLTEQFSVPPMTTASEKKLCFVVSWSCVPLSLFPWDLALRSRNFTTSKTYKLGKSSFLSPLSWISSIFPPYILLYQVPWYVILCVSSLELYPSAIALEYHTGEDATSLRLMDSVAAP